MSQPIPQRDEHIGYKYTTVLLLQRDGNGVVCASGVEKPDTRGVQPEEELYEKAVTEAVLGSSAVYFVIDGYYPGAKEVV
ncbi:hypothetical protein ACFL25_00165 [Patescibacteria group bacterium]